MPKPDHSWVARVGRPTIASIIENPHDVVEGFISTAMGITGKPLSLARDLGHLDVTLAMTFNVEAGRRTDADWEGVLSGVDELNLLILQARQAGTNPPLQFPPKQPTSQDSSTTYHTHVTICPDLQTASVHLEPVPGDPILIAEFGKCVVLDPLGSLAQLNDDSVCHMHFKEGDSDIKDPGITLVLPASGSVSVVYMWSPLPTDRSPAQAASAPGPTSPDCGCMRYTGTYTGGSTITINQMTYTVYPQP